MMRASEFAVVLALVTAMTCGIGWGQESRATESRAETKPTSDVFTPRTTGIPEVLVSLERTRCFGRCPEYSLTVFDDGAVKYEGKFEVHVIGTSEKVLDGKAFNLLVHAFLDARFSDLEKWYGQGDMTDMPSATLMFRWKGVEKQIYHYYGDVLAPRSLSKFERAVDDIVGSDDWTMTPRERRRLEEWRKSKHADDFLLGPLVWKEWVKEWTVGVVELVDPAGSSVTIRFDEGKAPPENAPLIIVRDQQYQARLKLVSVSGKTGHATIEHCEPGFAVAVGDPVWNK